MELECSFQCQEKLAIYPYPESTPISLKFILILSYRPYLDFPNGFFPSSIETKILYAFFIFLMRATCPALLILLDIFVRFLDKKCFGYRTWVHLQVK
jgi:hypothetical protein